MAAFSENFKILYKLSYSGNFGVLLVQSEWGWKKGTFCVPPVHDTYHMYMCAVLSTNLCLVLGPAVEVSPDWPGEITTQAVTHWDQEPRVNLLHLHRTYTEATEINLHGKFLYPNEISFNPHLILPYTILISKWYDSDIINALIWDDTKKNQKPITGVIWESYHFDMKIISYEHHTVKLGYSEVVGTN